MKETREQQLGRAIDRHISVSAGAGSGKTRVLVQRFIHILEQYPGIDLSSIIAITFTRKAAAEMMKRVMDAVEEKLQDAIIQERMLDVEMWSRIRQHLSSARISTIDSFCNQIVREYPIEAGVPHTITPLPTSKAVAMRMQCIEEALIYFLSSENPEHEKVHNLFHKHHHSTITNALDHLLKKGSMALQVLHKIHNQNEDAIIAHAWDAIGNELHSKMILIFDAVHRLPGFTDASYIGKQHVDAWKTLQLQCEKVLLGPLHEEVFQYLQSFDAVSKTIISSYVTQKKVPTANYHKFSDIPLDDWISSFYSLIDVTRTQCQGICIVSDIGKKLSGDSLSAEKEALQFSRLILDIAIYACSLFETQKRNEGTLEFSDVQSIAMELLDHPEAGPKIRSRIRFLMIDEFQDTNAMQYELASRIVRSLKGELSQSEVNLYIVGDPKQSIYGFRSADVRVFGQASKDIQKANQLNGTIHQSEHMSEEESTGKLSLSTSFRLLPGIIGFINDLFSTLMRESENGYEVGYEEMIGGRNVTHELMESHEIGSVTFLIHTQKEDDESQALIDEAGLIASAIKDMVLNKSKKVWDTRINEQGDKQPYLRDITYSDCTILYERRTMVNLLMAALRAEGIPYFTTGNKGFYTSPAIVDIRNYLTFLSNSNDDVALAGILLSPFFSVEDDDLYAIKSAYTQKSLWEGINLFVEFTSSIPEEVLHAKNILSALLHKAQTMPLPILIHTMLEASHWRNIVKTMEDGAQWLANADKIIAIAREFEQRGFRHIHAFVQELDLAAEFDDESEAPIVNTENAVNLMTIHASKGLEFPIVFLYDTNTKERSTAPALYESDQFGIGLPIIKEYRVSGAHDIEPSLLSMAVSMERKARALAEKKRLLYVALTRAKDHLFISTSHKEGKEFAEKSMMQLIATHSGAYQIVSQSLTSSLFETEIQILDTDQENRNNINVKIPISRQSSTIEIQLNQSDGETKQENVLQLFEQTKQEYKDEWYSTSQFMMLETDQSEFRKKYVFGFPDVKTEHHAGFMNDETHQDINAAQYGVLVHRILQHINTWINSDGEIASDILESMIDAEVNAIMMNSKEKNQVMITLNTLFRNIHQTELIQENIAHLSSAKTEYSLSIPVNEDFFVVIYDVVIEKEDGTAEIWDWKTNACSNEHEVDILSKRYEIQMKYYAYILHLLYPEQKTIITRLLFTNMIKDRVQADWMREYSWKLEEMPEIRKAIEDHIMLAKKSILL